MTKKQWAARILIGGLLGLAVMIPVGGVLNAMLEIGGMGISVFVPISRDLTLTLGTETRAMAAQLVLYFALGAVTGAATAPFADSGRELVLRSLAHFAATAALASLLIWLCFWNWGEWLVWLIELGLLAAVYLLIWLVRWVVWYAELAAIRRGLGLEPGPSQPDRRGRRPKEKQVISKDRRDA